MEQVILTLGKGRTSSGVIVDGIPVGSIPGLYLTRPLDPVEGQDEWVVTHAASGYVVTRAESDPIVTRRLMRLRAVTRAFEIDWTAKTPVAKRDRRRMAAVRWAIDPVAAMFNAPCPDAIETIMAEGLSATIPDTDVRILLG